MKILKKSPCIKLNCNTFVNNTCLVIINPVIITTISHNVGYIDGLYSKRRRLKVKRNNLTLISDVFLLVEKSIDCILYNIHII